VSAYKDPELRRMSHRCSVRKHRHGNWRQTYIDCAGICVARVNGGEVCGAVRGLELHEQFGENGQRNDPRFQVRMLLCNFHHAMVDDHYHQSSFISDQPNPSLLAEDVSKEIELAGSYKDWLEKYKLDDSRFGCLVSSGPVVEDCGDG